MWHVTYTQLNADGYSSQAEAAGRSLSCCVVYLASGNAPSLQVNDESATHLEK